MTKRRLSNSTEDSVGEAKRSIDENKRALVKALTFNLPADVQDRCHLASSAAATEAVTTATEAVAAETTKEEETGETSKYFADSAIGTTSSDEGGLATVAAVTTATAAPQESNSADIYGDEIRRIASELLGPVRIVAEHVTNTENGIEHNKQRYRIEEVEFYIHDEDTEASKPFHVDPFAHAHILQRQHLMWYFHRTGKTDKHSYKAASRKGMDITLGYQFVRKAQTDGNNSNGDNDHEDGNGDKDDDASDNSAEMMKEVECPNRVVHTGVLIRAIRRVYDKKVDYASKEGLIEGPSLVVDELLRATGYSNIADLVSKGLAGDISAQQSPLDPIRFVDETLSSLRLEYEAESASSSSSAASASSSSASASIFSGPRVGLFLNSAKGVDAQIRFVGRNYRFYRNPQVLDKGRVQTAFGAMLHTLNQHQKDDDDGDSDGDDEDVDLDMVKLVDAVSKTCGSSASSTKTMIASVLRGSKLTPSKIASGSQTKVAEIAALLGCALQHTNPDTINMLKSLHLEV
ncbi:hypothetical protein GQ42DRAFT_161108 [Ramicandelaber brevisporus]|nr:hypothetical protein GQ42DRAFT_161108 [Ramicandelaber brevisporus]